MASSRQPNKSALEKFLEKWLRKILYGLNYILVIDAFQQLFTCKFQKRFWKIIFENACLIAGSLVLLYNWQQEKITLANRQEIATEYESRRNIANIMIHDVKLREFETDNIRMHRERYVKSKDLDTALLIELDTTYFRNVLHECLARNVCLYQFKLVRDIDTDMVTRIKDTVEMRELDSIATFRYLTNNFDTINNFKIADRARFNPEINLIQAQGRITDMRLKRDLEKKTKEYECGYMVATILIGLDWLIKKVNEKYQESSQ